MKAIYKMNFDCGRSGNLYGIFVAEKDKMNDLIGTEIYFGEVLGKHSEVCGPLTDEEIELVTDDEAVVELFVKHDLSSGYNPFWYVNEEECEEEDED